MSTDRSTVEAVVKNYFDALYEGDADKMSTVFDSSADLRWVEKGELQVLTVPDWLDRIRKRPSGKAEGKTREDFIVTIDRSDDNTAFVKVRCQLAPRRTVWVWRDGCAILRTRLPPELPSIVTGR